MTNDPTYAEAVHALEHYVPGDQFGTPHCRRVNAMREALRAFLRAREIKVEKAFECNETNDGTSDA